MATIDQCIEVALKKYWSFDKGTELADIAMNENILLLDEYSKVRKWNYFYTAEVATSGWK